MIDLSSKNTIEQGIISDAELDRAWIESHTVSRHRTAGSTRPDLRVVEWNGKRIAVKDFRYSSPAFRYVVGRILIRREYGALKKLIGVKGIPQLIKRIDAYAIAMEHIPHLDFDAVELNWLDDGFYESLRESVDMMHERGVAHCDLRTFGNVMVGEDGCPYIVDFAACVYRGKGINPITRWLFRQFVEADKYAALKVKRRFSPDRLTPEELKQLDTPLPLEKPAKAVGHFIRRVVKRIAARSYKHQKAL